MKNFPSTSEIAPKSVFCNTTVAPGSAVCAFLSMIIPEILPFCAEAIEHAMNAMNVFHVDVLRKGDKLENLEILKKRKS